MSSLTSIKDRLINVQQGLSDRFKSVGKFISGNATRSSTDHDNVTSSQVSQVLDLDAGADALDKFQRAWADIHKGATTCSQDATIVDSEIMKLKGQIDDFYEKYKVLHMELAELPAIINSIESSSRAVEDIAEELIEVERLLEELDFVNRRVDFENLKQKHRLQLQKYRESKAQECIRMQKSLEHEKAHREELQEEKQRKKLLDRQRTFEEEFLRDLNLFKTKGQLERPLSQCSSTGSAKLEDIIVDDDKDSQMMLDAFLATEDKDKTSEEVEAMAERDHDNVPMINNTADQVENEPPCNTKIEHNDQVQEVDANEGQVQD